jgi:proteasome lid subunit RPN8/RPN11
MLRIYARDEQARGREAVALLGVDTAGHIAWQALDNAAKSRSRFFVPVQTLVAALTAMRHNGATRVILFHSHAKGAAVPSNMHPNGDVQQLGDPHWIKWIESELQVRRLELPLLHMIYSVAQDRARLFRIDARLGPLVTRKINRQPVRVHLGWEEVTL